MKFCYLHPVRCLILYLGLILACAPVSAQDEPPEFSNPINLDEAMQEPVPHDRAASYYHFALAKWNERNGNLPKALSQMQDALNYNRDSAILHLELATLLEKSGRIQEAITHAQEASRLDPDSPDPHGVLANIYFKSQGRGSNSETIQKAVQELEIFLELAPENLDAYYYLGRAYFELNQPEKAIEAYEKLQSLTPGNDTGYFEIANYYKITENYDKAIEYLEKALDIRPDSGKSLELLGEIYTKLNKSKDASQVYKRLLQSTRDNINVKRKLVLTLIESDQNSEAIDLLDQIILADPGKVDDQVLLGRAQIGLRKFGKAIETLGSISTKDPGLYISTQFYLGIAYRNNEAYSEAIKIFTDLLNSSNFSEENQKDRLVFQHHLALSYLGNGDHEEAIALYQEMVKSDPDINYELMNAYRLGRQYEKAIQIGELEHQKNPNDIRRGILYAQTLADAGKTDAGVEILKELLVSNPLKVDVYIYLSQIYLQDKRYSEAEKILHQAEKLEFQNENAERQIQYELASVYENQEDYDRLVSLLSDIIESNPEDMNAKYYLYAIYEKQKDYDRAESLLSEIIELNPGNMDAKYYLATVYERQKDYDRAEILFKEVIEDDPENAGALNYFGYMLADREIRLYEAIDYIEKALAIDPENGAYLDSLGWAYFKLNDLANAEKYLLQAFQRVKDDPVIDDHLGDLYYKSGDFQKARDFWLQSIEIGTEQEDIKEVQGKLDMLLEQLPVQELAE